MKLSHNALILPLAFISALCALIGTIWYVRFSGGLLAVKLVAAGYLIQEVQRAYYAYKSKNKRDIIVHSLFLCFFLGMMIFVLFFLK